MINAKETIKGGIMNNKDRVVSVVEQDGFRVEISYKSLYGTLGEALRVVDQCLRGAGFCYDGEVDIINEEREGDETKKRKTNKN